MEGSFLIHVNSPTCLHNTEGGTYWVNHMLDFFQLLETNKTSAILSKYRPVWNQYFFIEHV